MIPLTTISSEIFHALSNGPRLLLFQFGTASTEGGRQLIKDLYAATTIRNSLFKRLILEHTDMFPRFATGIAGLSESFVSEALRILCIRNLLSGSEDRRFLSARPSGGAIGGGVGRATMREEAPRRGVCGIVGVYTRVGICVMGGRVVYRPTRAEKTSPPPPGGRRGVRGITEGVSIRIGVRTAGESVVCRPTRAEETGPPPGGRRGWDRLWLSDGLIIPGIPEERHAESRYCKRRCARVGFDSHLWPHCVRLYSQSDTLTSVELSGSPPSRFVEGVALSSPFTAPIVASR